MSTGPMSVKKNTAEIARITAQLEALQERMETDRKLNKTTTKRLAEKTTELFYKVDRQAQFVRYLVATKYPEFKVKWKDFLKERSAAKTLRSLGSKLKLSKF